MDHPDEVLDAYFRQCSLRVTTVDLARMAATLARGGINPQTGRRVTGTMVVQRTLSVMVTCGMYNAAGDWVSAVGMPAKSGVGGGILAVLPGQLGIGVYSPLLDSRGNSVRGVQVCRALSERLGLHFLTVSRLDAPKRIDLAIHALAYLRRDVPLVVVGDGPQRAYLEMIAARDPRVRIAGMVPEGLKPVLAGLVEGRKSEDVFPTFYRANDDTSVRRFAAGAGLEIDRLDHISTYPGLGLVPPLAFVELLWIRLLERPSLTTYRHNLVCALRKPARA